MNSTKSILAYLDKPIDEGEALLGGQTGVRVGLP
jgi:hypothetical protein